MTEAIGGEEQIVGLIRPVVALGTGKDDLVLYAGGEGETQLRGRINLKDAALAGSSSTDRLLGAPIEAGGRVRFGAEVAAEDMERDLILRAHSPAGAFYVKIELGGCGSEAVGGCRAAGNDAYRHYG